MSSNQARDLFYKLVDEHTDRSKERNNQLESFFKSLDKEIQPFLKAVNKFAKTGELDAETLKIDLNLELSTGTRRGRGRKLATLTENAEENEAVKVKQEKISEVCEPKSTRSSVSSTTSSVTEIPKENIKIENDEMPAPSWIPPKKKLKEIKVERASVRSARTKGRKATMIRDSDVVVQNAVIPTINLSDTEESDVEIPTRSTRSKARKKTQIIAVDSGTETDTESTRSTKSTRTKTRNTAKEGANTENDAPEETRSTRTKTIRKGRKTEEEIKKDEIEEIQPEVRSARTKTIRKAKDTEETTENNNVQSNNVDEKIEVEPIRSTRTKTRKLAESTLKDTAPANEADKPAEEAKSKSAIPEPTSKAKHKRNRSDKSDSTDEEVAETKERKKSKSNSPAHDNQENTTTQTVYEDAVTSIGPPLDKPFNSTFTAAKPGKAEASAVPSVPPLNATVIIEAKSSAVEHQQYNIFDQKSNDMITDDDSLEEKTPPEKFHTSKATNQVFSPYDKTTLKKKVEAFERLQNGSEIPIKTGSASKNIRGTPSSVKEKAKIFTPLAMKFMPLSSSTSKINKLTSSQQQNASSSNDSSSGVKSTQRDLRERQKKMLEREQAMKKKEAMLQAQADAKRRLNEEKQLKAQQQRKMLEAEKLKQLEVQKQKEEKLKQRELERGEYAQKQKLELQKERLAKAKNIQEAKAQRQQLLAEQAKIRPAYMLTEAAKLPTVDCYDSDEPEYKTEYKKLTYPSWCIGDRSRIKLFSMTAAGEKIKNTFFCVGAVTPDLQEIFEAIDPRKLKRSSSILWRKPPRYTMMADLNETKFSEDEELYEDD